METASLYIAEYKKEISHQKRDGKQAKGQVEEERGVVGKEREERQ